MFTVKRTRSLFSLMLLFSCSCLYAGQTVMKTLFTLEHASGYKIIGREYENSRLQSEPSIQLKKTGVINKPTDKDHPHIDEAINKICHEFMRNPDEGRPDVYNFDSAELSTLFKLSGVRMPFPGTKQCNDPGYIYCLPYKKFRLKAGPGGEHFVTETDEAVLDILSYAKWSFIHTKIAPSIFHVHELGNFYFEASEVFIQPGLLVIQGYINTDLVPSSDQGRDLLYLRENRDNLKPVTVAVWYKDHAVVDYEDVGKFVSIKTHFLKDYKITEKYISLFVGHLKPWDMSPINKHYYDGMGYRQVLKYSALTVPGFDETLLREVIRRMGFRTDIFAESVFPFDFWTFETL